MLFPKDTRVTNKTREVLIDFIESVFNDTHYNKGIGKKPLKVITTSQEEPSQPYIRIHRLGGRVPWCMGDGNYRWHEYEIVYMLDVRVPETDQRQSDVKETKAILKNYESGKSSVQDDNGEIVDNICDSLVELFELQEWRERLSELGIHNMTLVDEREGYSGAEYQNPLRLTFNAYVII
jgi:hypothetical protein